MSTELPVKSEASTMSKNVIVRRKQKLNRSPLVPWWRTKPTQKPKRVSRPLFQHLQLQKLFGMLALNIFLVLSLKFLRRLFLLIRSVRSCLKRLRRLLLPWTWWLLKSWKAANCMFLQLEPPKVKWLNRLPFLLKSAILTWNSQFSKAMPRLIVKFYFRPTRLKNLWNPLKIWWLDSAF